MITAIEELETVFDSFAPSMPDERTRERRLERMEALLDRLGNPEKAYRTYHIAGSKGKGSTAAYLAALLEGSGKVCGLYTSPHLFTIRERFTLSGKFFPDEFYITICNELLARINGFGLPEELGPEKPTVFEMYTAYGYMLFQRWGCTDAVIETGLGGRLDATNTIMSEAVFLTPIELEHTDVLGETITAIAREKAGIIRTNSPVFTAEENPDADKVFREKAETMDAPYYPLPEFLAAMETETTIDGEQAELTLNGKEYKLHLKMATKAMAENAALAILGADKLGFLTENGIREMERVQLPGRFERRTVENHLVVIDTAHTVHSAAVTRDAFIRIAKNNPVLIFTLVAGKDEDGIMKTLFPPFRRVIITKPSGYKKSNPAELAGRAESIFPEKHIIYIESPDAALDVALREESSILITGSFYLASEMSKLRG